MHSLKLYLSLVTQQTRLFLPIILQGEVMFFFRSFSTFFYYGVFFEDIQLLQF